MIDYQQDSPGKMCGIPDFLRRDTPEKIAACAKAWDGLRPASIASFIAPKDEKQVAPDTAALLAELSADSKIKKANKETKKQNKKIDRTGLRWDSRSNKWVPENQPTSAARARDNQAAQEGTL